MTFKWTKTETEDYTAPAFCHRDKKKIVLTYPLPADVDLTPIQVLSHEIGHWYFDRYFDDKVTSDKKIEKRSDIRGYEYYSEMAAIFCESVVSKNVRTKGLPPWVSDRLMPDLDEIISLFPNVPKEIIARLDTKWSQQKEKKIFPYDK
jgi:hypothetical protein